MKFQTVIVVIATGEVDLTADNVNVYTEPKFTVTPNLMFSGKPVGVDTPEEEALLARIITFNVLHRACGETHIPGVTTGVPVPVGGEVPPKDRS